MFLIFLQSTKNEISWRRSVFLGGDIASVCFLWHLSLLYIQYSSRWPRSTHRSQKPTCVCHGGHYHNTGDIYLLWKLSSLILQENIYCSKSAIDFFCLCRFFFSYYLSRMLSDVGYTLAVMILRNLEDKLLHFYSYVTLPCG